LNIDVFWNLICNKIIFNIVYLFFNSNKFNDVHGEIYFLINYNVIYEIVIQSNDLFGLVSLYQMLYIFIIGNWKPSLILLEYDIYM